MYLHEKRSISLSHRYTHLFTETPLGPALEMPNGFARDRNR